jgi:ATP-dependent helicase/nuclease subunit A
LQDRIVNDKHLDNWELTEPQKRGVTQVGTNLIVTAGAGTGKTRVLTHRLAHLVLSGQAELGEVLAITFTEKAAAEMSRRIGKIFEEVQRPDLRRQVHLGSISTIHAFCKRLLSEHSLTAGVDPDFTVLSDLETHRLIDESLKSALDSLKSEAGDGYVKLTRTIRTEGRFGPDILGAVRRIYNELRAGTGGLDAPFQPDPNAVDTFNSLLTSLPALLESYRNAVASKKTATVEANETIIAGIEAALETPDPEKIAVALCDAKLGRRLSKDAKPFAEAVNEALAELSGYAAEVHAHDTRVMLGELVRRFDREFREAKRAVSALDFSDLEQAALHLLKTEPEVQRAVNERYKQVLVDEYQDVNPLQAELISRISGTDNRMVVGDYKQSIYRFRQADVSVFSEAIQNAPENGRIDLSLNFRTDVPIIDLVNGFFETVWREETESPAYEPLSAGNPEEQQGSPDTAVELLVSRAQPDQNSREVEAKTLADRIARLIEKENFKPGDIAILFRAKTQVAPFLAELLQRQIPFSEVKGRGFFGRAEVVDLANLMTVLADPYDELALAAVLRSPFVRLDDESLFRLCGLVGKDRGGLFTACREAEAIDGLSASARVSLADFLLLLDGLDADRTRLSLSDLVRAAYERSGYRNWALTQPDGPRKSANIDAMIRRSVAFADPYGPSPAGLARAISDFRDQGLALSDAATGSTESSVAVMSVHAAKGLEAPVVVLADLAHQGNVQTAPILYHPAVGVGFKVYAEGGVDVETVSGKAVRDRIREDEKRESLRLLYVAMTRAENKLVLSGAFKLEASGRMIARGWLKTILDHVGLSVKEFDQWPKQVLSPTPIRIVKNDGMPESETKAPEPAVIDKAALLEQYDELPERLERPDGSRYLYSVSEITEFASCARRFYLRHRLGLPLEMLTEETVEPGDEPSETESDTSRAAAIGYGIAVHEIFARTEPTSKSLADLAAKISAQHGLSEEETAKAADAVRTFFANPDVKSILTTGSVHRELPFLWKFQEKLIRGQVDLVVVNDDGFQLVDFKTNRGSDPDSIARRYRLQMILYALAAESLFKRPATQVSLYLTEAGRFVDLAIGDSDIAEAKSLLGRIFEADRLGRYPAHEERCDGCRHRRWCIVD